LRSADAGAGAERSLDKGSTAVAARIYLSTVVGA